MKALARLMSARQGAVHGHMVDQEAAAEGQSPHGEVLLHVMDIGGLHGLIAAY